MAGMGMLLLSATAIVLATVLATSRKRELERPNLQQREKAHKAVAKVAAMASVQKLPEPPQAGCAAPGSAGQREEGS
jgi:hypothetical protein